MAVTYQEIVAILKKKNFQKRIDELVQKYKDQKVIIYGTGMVFDAIRKNFDISKLNIIALSDIKFKEEGEFEGYKTISPDTIASESPEIVLISMYAFDRAMEYFDKKLIPEYGKFKYKTFIEYSFFDLFKYFFEEKQNNKLNCNKNNIMNGMSESEIEKLCSDEDLNKGNAEWLYWSAEVYSFGRHIRNYGFYPSFLPLYVYADHGPGFANEPAPHELESSANVQLYHSPVSVENWKKYSNKPCYTIHSPLVYYRRKNKITQKPNLQGTLAFPSHSTPQIDNVCDIELYIQQLKELPEEFQPVSVCLHMHDIHKGQHKIFLKHGFPVYTAGNSLDHRFAERFYNILRNFKYTTSNLIGSYTNYSVEMGIPFSLYGIREKFINKTDTNLEIGEYDPLEHKYYKQAYDLFSGFHREINAEQEFFVEKHLGLYDSISRLKLASILYGTFIKRVNLIDDIRLFKKIKMFIKFYINTLESFI